MSPLVKCYSPRSFEIPAQDVYDAAVHQVDDLGEIKGFDGEAKHKVKLIWKLDAYNSRNYPYEIHQTLNASLHPKSALFRTITDITGRAPAAGEDFELSTLVGKKVRIVVKHNTADDGRVYANVASIMRPLSQAEREEERRVQAMTAKVIAAAERPQSRTAVAAFSAPRPDNDDLITDVDVPF